MNESNYLPHFNIISLSGTARSDGMSAIALAREGKIEEAKAQLKQANDELVEAHQAMFSMLQKEMNGESIDMNIVAVHAQDHISMATVVCELAEEFIHLYEERR